MKKHMSADGTHLLNRMGKPRGVYYDKRVGYFYARPFPLKTILGKFVTKEEAEDAIAAWWKERHFLS